MWVAYFISDCTNPGRPWPPGPVPLAGPHLFATELEAEEMGAVWVDSFPEDLVWVSEVTLPAPPTELYQGHLTEGRVVSYRGYTLTQDLRYGHVEVTHSATGDFLGWEKGFSEARAVVDGYHVAP